MEEIIEVFVSFITTHLFTISVFGTWATMEILETTTHHSFWDLYNLYLDADTLLWRSSLSCNIIAWLFCVITFILVAIKSDSKAAKIATTTITFLSSLILSILWGMNHDDYVPDIDGVQPFHLGFYGSVFGCILTLVHWVWLLVLEFSK